MVAEHSKLLKYTDHPENCSKEFIKEAFNHPEWPSMGDLYKHYEKETNKKDI